MTLTFIKKKHKNLTVEQLESLFSIQPKKEFETQFFVQQSTRYSQIRDRTHDYMFCGEGSFRFFYIFFASRVKLAFWKKMTELKIA